MRTDIPVDLTFLDTSSHSIGYRIVPRYSSFLINGAEHGGGGLDSLYRNTDQHPDRPPHSTFYRTVNEILVGTIKHELSFHVVEISKITVGELSFDQVQDLAIFLVKTVFHSDVDHPNYYLQFECVHRRTEPRFQSRIPIFCA